MTNINSPETRSLAKTWSDFERQVRGNTASLLTAAFLLTSAMSCSSPAEKINKNEALLKVKIENFYSTRKDALATENLYNQAKKRGDRVDTQTHKIQMEKLKTSAIEKMEEIQHLQIKNTKLLIKDRKDAEKSAGADTKTLTREDALKFTP